MTATTSPRTIARNATRQIAALRDMLSACKVYTLDNYFIGAEVPPESAWDALERRNAKLRDNGNGTYTVTVHSNCWYQLREETLDEAAARHDEEMFGPQDADLAEGSDRP